MNIKQKYLNLTKEVPIPYVKQNAIRSTICQGMRMRSLQPEKKSSMPTSSCKKACCHNAKQSKFSCVIV